MEAYKIIPGELTYKTELCRTHIQTGTLPSPSIYAHKHSPGRFRSVSTHISEGQCAYGERCQFAHGIPELRAKPFDSKYYYYYCAGENENAEMLVFMEHRN